MKVVYILRRDIAYNRSKLKLLYPDRCMICGRVLWQYEQGICGICEKVMPVITGDRCVICSKSVRSGEIRCRDCMARRHEYERGYALLSYNRITRKIIAGIKYSGRTAEYEYIANELVYHSAPLIYMWNIDAVIPVPLHKRKIRQRGFNQAGLIGFNLANRLGIRYIDDMLIRNRCTRPQKLFDAEGRKNNLMGAFEVNKNRLALCRRLHNVLITDDIYTSGSTIDECSLALKKAGVDNIYFVCLCIGDGY